MYIPDTHEGHLEAFLHFINNTGGQIKSYKPPNPDYRGEWRGQLLIGYRDPNGVNFSSSNIKELQDLWNTALQELRDESGTTTEND